MSVLIKGGRVITAADDYVADVYVEDERISLIGESLDIVLKNGPTLGAGHQRWQLNEINALIWPNEGRFGVMDEEDFQRTADIAKQFGVIKADPSPDAYTTDYAEAALKQLEDEGVDVKGADWQKEDVEVTEGGN